MSAEQVREIEISIESLKATVEDHEALKRLANNKDFQRIIDTGYFVDSAVSMVETLADPEMQAEDKQAGVMKSIHAIGELKQYFKVIVASGKRARRELEQHEATLEEVLAEDLISE